jgi:hypothetical protein
MKQLLGARRNNRHSNGKQEGYLAGRDLRSHLGGSMEFPLTFKDFGNGEELHPVIAHPGILVLARECRSLSHRLRWLLKREKACHLRVWFVR